MSEKEPDQPTREEIKTAEDTMIDIQGLRSKDREKVGKDGGRIEINEEGTKMLIKGNEIYLGRYMTVQYAGESSIRGKKEFEEELISAEAAFKRLEQEEVGVKIEMERLQRIMDNIGILKNRVLEMQAKQEKKES